MYCRRRASCCGGGPDEGVSVGVLVYLAPCLARMTDEGAERCVGVMERVVMGGGEW